jgi:hypothetical protein
MIVADFESEVMEKAATIDGIEVDFFPELDKNVLQPTDKPRAYVGYQHSEFFNAGGSDNTNYLAATDFVMQNEFAYVAVIILAKLLRGENGLFDAYERLCAKLIGFAPSNCDKLHMVSFMPYKNEAGGVLGYTMLMRCQSMRGETEDGLNTTPLLNTVTLNTTTN